MTLRLMDGVKVPLTTTQMRSLEIIDGWDFSSERRKTQKDMITIGQDPTEGFLDRGIFALRKYHAIAVLDPLNGHAISDVLDPFWHSQILHTEPYVRFCNEVLGQYMHHYPLDHLDVPEVGRVGRLYEYTIEIHQRIFGGNDEEFYPSSVVQDRVICYHGGNAQSAGETIFAVRPELALA
ncbi:MAG: hypothetical protein AAB534_02410 [Patescibacteria group bacterium]